MIHINREFAARLERAEAANQVEYVRTEQSLKPASTAAFEAIGSGYAIFAGLDSPLTQCFGMGFDGEVTEAEVVALEDFYKRHEAPVNIEVSHLADFKLTQMLMERGYKIIEYSNVLVRQLVEGEEFRLTSGLEVRRIKEAEIEALARVIARGFLETEETPESFLELFRVYLRQPNCVFFGAFVEAAAAGGGALFLQDEIATFGGASTLVAHRRRGIQSDLLRARLAYALAKGCRLAMVTTMPGSLSQRNVESCGFQVAYARTKFFRAI